METLALEGIDNVGKTSVIKLLKKALESEGKIVNVSAPHREAEPSQGSAIYEGYVLGGQAAREVNQLVIETADRARQEALEMGADYLIYDRHWMTGYTMTEDAKLRELWPRVRTALLVPGRRPLEDMAEDEPWSSVTALEDFSRRYEKIRKAYWLGLLGIYTVEQPCRDIPLVAQSILWDMRIQR